MTNNISEHTVNPIRDNIPLMADCCWQLAIHSIWPCNIFTTAEKTRTTVMLRNQLRQAADPFRAYLEIGERILISAEELFRYPEIAFSIIPSTWLKIKQGYARSLQAFQQRQQMRKSLPGHCILGKALPEAVLEMAEDPSRKNFHYWLYWFREREALDELSIFYACCAHNTYHY